MIGPRNVHPDELGEAEGMELEDAMRVGNRLADAMEDVPLRPGEDFTDRVMAALAHEPTPGPAGFLVPLRRRGLVAGFRESVRQAWAAVGSGRPILGRTAALAYVLAAVIAGVSLTGVVTLGAAGALGLLGPQATQSPAPTTPVPTEPPATIAPPSEPPPSIDPTQAPMPSPSETDENESEGPDDNGGNSGPGGGGDDNSGPGSGSDDSSGSGSGSDDSSGSDSGSDDRRTSGPG